MAVNFVHLIPNLEAGGAERQLCNLAIAEASQGYTPKVIVLSDRNSVLKQELEHAGVEVLSFPLSGLKAPLSLLKLLVTLVRLDNSKYVLTAWMYHACFISVMVKLFHPRLRCFWMIRRTSIPAGLTGLLSWFNAKFSRLVPEVIVANSAAGLQTHIKAGYCDERFIYIPNLIDCKRFSPVADKKTLRAKLDIPQDIPLFVCAARYAPVKGHLQLLAAMQRIEDENFICVLLGRGIDQAKPLVELLGPLVSKGRVRVFGESSDIASLLPALDFLVLPSLSEGFPNVVAEAMAAGLPCIVTDVGDAAQIVADTGVVVPPGDIDALAKAIAMWLHLPNEQLISKGKSASLIVNQRYSIHNVLARYRALVETDY